MPYLNHSMAHSINEAMSASSGSSQSSSSASEPCFSNRFTRSMPGCTHKGEEGIFQHTDKLMADRYKLQMTQRKLLFMRTLLRASVKQIDATVGAVPLETNKLSQAYKVNQNVVLHESEHFKILEAKSSLAPGTAMAVRLYPTKAETSSLHLKILRYLGRKHPYIVHTYELFYDAESVFVFQEWCTLGNLVEYMEQCQPLSEREAVIWARQVHRALDFLGDQAIAHRDLSPIHLVVQPQHNGEVWLKLTGFKNAVIYWDCQTNDVIFLPCLPLEQQTTDGCNFQAPEVYGDSNKEQFDPILADIWSYGANIYYMLCKQYPYNSVDPFESLDQEIWHNLVRTSLSEECKCFLFALMRANANDRMPFDFIDGQPWMNPSIMVATPKAITSSKHQVAGKSYNLLKQPRVIVCSDMLHEVKTPTPNKDACLQYKCCQNNSKLRTKMKNFSASSGQKTAVPPVTPATAEKVAAKKEVARCWCKSKNKPVESTYCSIIVAREVGASKGPVSTTSKAYSKSANVTQQTNIGNFTGLVNFGKGGGNALDCCYPSKASKGGNSSSDSSNKKM